MSHPAVRLVDLTVTHQRHPAVHHLNGELALGSLTAVIGPNGAGKSSLLDALAGRMPINAGRIEIAPELAGRIAYLPQQSHIDRSFPIGVLDLVALGHWPRRGAFGALDTAQVAKAREALAAVGLGGFEARRIGELSVGQFQRVLFARLLLQDARLILLDEPFNGVDARTCADLLRVVHGWHREGRTVVAVLHDMELVREHFPQALLLAREVVAWGATPEVLRPATLARARRMAEGWDETAPVCERA